MRRRSVKYVLSISLAGLCVNTAKVVTKPSTGNVCSPYLTHVQVEHLHRVLHQLVYHIAVLPQLPHRLWYTMQPAAAVRGKFWENVVYFVTDNANVLVWIRKRRPKNALARHLVRLLVRLEARYDFRL